MTQIAIRLPEDTVVALAELMASGEFETRADAVRTAITTLADQRRRDAVGRAIADGYRRHPQTDEEVEAARRAAVASIQDEPW